MKSKKNKKNKSSGNNTKNNSSNKNNSNNTEKLLKDLAIIDLSDLALYFVIMAVLISLQDSERNRNKILNDLMNGNDDDEISEETFIESSALFAPRLSNKLFLIANIIGFYISYDLYITVTSVNPEERDEQEIQDAYEELVARILVIIGTLINYRILNRVEE